MENALERGWRIDGLSKVTGQRVYGSDYRPADVGWKGAIQHVVLLRYQRPGERWEGVDLASIPEDLQPDLLFTASEVIGKGIANDAGWLGKELILTPGTVASYVGQPVALAYFKEHRTWRRFKDWLLKDGSEPLRYAPGVAPGRIEEQDIRTVLSPLLAGHLRRMGTSYLPPSKPDPQGVASGIHYVRVNTAPDGEDEFSHFRDGAHNPSVDEPAQKAVARIEALLKAEKVRTLERTFSTPTNDPMFMEMEAGIAWMDREAGCLRIVAGTQSPEKDRQGILDLLRKAFPGIQIDYRACAPGGGFGGRDLSSFCLYLAVAAVMAEGPVRLAYDRYEQFQVGIKRHASAVHGRLCYSETGRLRAYFCKAVFDGGGTPNLTSPVVSLATLQAAGPYAFPMSVIRGDGFHTHGATAGSMRGFGIPQVVFAIETLVDEAAAELRKDPIEMRLGQLLSAGMRDVTGYTLRHPIGITELCRMALKEPLWTERESTKDLLDNETTSYGVGFACCMESFGTSRDAVLCAVEMEPEGVRVVSPAMDMGQGSGTSLSVAVGPGLGRGASEVRLGEDAYFDVLSLKVVNGTPTAPNETPKRGSAMSASMTAFFHLHAAEQAARLLFEVAIRPAARSLWGTDVSEMVWREGELCADGMRSLTWQEIWGEVQRLNLPTGAMVHSFFKGTFAECDFPLREGAVTALPFDALALRSGSGEYRIVPRTAARYPSGGELKSQRSLYAAAGHLVAVRVNRRTGRIVVDDVVSFLDPGIIHVEAFVRGQVEGGFAMGLGMALHEELPAPLAGVAPNWNLHRYTVPRAKHVPVGRLHQLRFVPPSEGGHMKKGIAEATMTTVPAAIANAIAHAIGSRMNRLPIRPADVLAALSTDGTPRIP